MRYQDEVRAGRFRSVPLSLVAVYTTLRAVQNLLKGRAGGKAKFDEKKLPALRSIK
jgi:hypothetical protein